jgi:DNA polymerase-3 subunit epsilon
MPVLCGIDLETTGVEPHKSEITEIGYAIFDTENWDKPLVMESQMCKIAGTVPAEIVELTGITDDILKRSGIAIDEVLGKLHANLDRFGVEYMVAHNGTFDKDFLAYHSSVRELPKIKQEWVDTKNDIPFPKRIRNTNLVALAAEHGFLNPFPHAALFDVFTMMKVLSQYDIKEVLAYRAEPKYFLQAMVDYANRALASKRGYKWQECEGKVFAKTWVKAVKARFVEKEESEAPFTIKIIGEVK